MQATLHPNGKEVFTAELGEVFGWFAWQELYDRCVEEAPRNGILVEVGVFCGKSLIYLAEKAKAANKGLKVYGVDTFQGSPEFEGMVYFNEKTMSQWPSATIINECVENIAKAGLRDDVTLIVSDSVKAADLFWNNDVSMVFLDAGHDFVSVCRDIQAWLPKVERGGTMAGDDVWVFPTVEQAVDLMLPEATKHKNRCWWEAKL